MLDTGQKVQLDSAVDFRVRRPDRVRVDVSSSGRAALLPALIDQLIPKGQIEHGVDLGSALNALRGKLMA